MIFSGFSTELPEAFQDAGFPPLSLDSSEQAHTAGPFSFLVKPQSTQQITALRFVGWRGKEQLGKMRCTGWGRGWDDNDRLADN